MKRILLILHVTIYSCIYTYAQEPPFQRFYFIAGTYYPIKGLAYHQQNNKFYSTGIKRGSSGMQRQMIVSAFKTNMNDLWVNWFQAHSSPFAEGMSICIGKDELLYGTGFNSGPNTIGGNDIAVFKYDTSGSYSPGLLWTTYIGSNKQDRAFAIKVDSKGNLLVGGFLTNSDNSKSSILFKLSQDGTTVKWARLLGNGNGYNSDAIYDLELDEEDNVYFVSEIKNAKKLRIGKFDSTGIAEWIRVIEDTNINAITCNSIALKQEGDIYIAGNIEVQGNHGHKNAFMASFSNQGALNYFQVYENNANEIINDIHLKSNGEIILAGSSNDDDYMNIGTDALAICIQEDEASYSNNTIKCSHLYEAFYNDAFTQIIEKPSGQVMFVGETDGKTPVGSFTVNQAYIVQIDSNGNSFEDESASECYKTQQDFVQELTVDNDFIPAIVNEDSIEYYTPTVISAPTTVEYFSNPQTAKYCPVTKNNFDYTVDCSSLEITFEDISSSGTKSWSWDFGDTTTLLDVSNDPNPQYTYPTPGEYVVKLTTIDYFDDTTTTQKIITVYNSIASDIIVDTLIDGTLYRLQENTEVANYYWTNNGDSIHDFSFFDLDITINGNNEVCLIVDYFGCSSEKCVELNMATSIFEPNIELSVYPNPFTDKLKIEIPSLQGIELSIQNKLGQTVWYDNIQNSSYIEVSTSSLSSGIYYLSMKGNDFEAVNKIFKK